MKSHDKHECGVCQPKFHERNHYYYGKQFTVRDLETEQRYFLDKIALLTRTILGWGVVCGLELELCDRQLIVKPGMALDCCGRQIVVCEPFSICLESLIKECPRESYAICLEYDECMTEETKFPADECEGGERHEYNRIRDHYRIRLKHWDNRCHARGEDCFPCPDHGKRSTNETPQRHCPPPSLHSYLCHQLECHKCDCCACVVLGKIILSDPPALDDCTHRRIVYSNPMLFRLLECYHGDLAHIIDFNWREKTRGAVNRRVSWEWFEHLMDKGLTLHFDRPMDPQSISRHTFIVTLTFGDPDSGRIRTERVRGKFDVKKDGDCDTVTFHPSHRWRRDESDFSVLRQGFDVEITLRGSNIYSKGEEGRPGRPLDGELIRDMLPTGNNSPGGDFFDWFHVEGPLHNHHTGQQEENLYE